MADNKQKTANNQESSSQQQEVHIEPSETKKSSTGDPGRTPGKAEGEDDESATK